MDHFRTYKTSAAEVIMLVLAAGVASIGCFGCAIILWWTMGHTWVIGGPLFTFVTVFWGIFLSGLYNRFRAYKEDKAPLPHRFVWEEFEKEFWHDVLGGE